MAVQGIGPLPPELAGMLYQEKFCLSTRQLDAEPPERIWYWLALEEERQKEEKRRNP